MKTPDDPAARTGRRVRLLHHEGRARMRLIRNQPPTRAVLYDSLGTYSYRVTTSSPQAQRWFDQGLRLVYAFNHQEAQRAFREAARLDPACAMCFWGIAMTEGGNYNHPTDAEREKRALTAVDVAQQRAAGAQPVERAFIQAVAKRHTADPAAKREALDRAYADAMREVARQFPDDLEAGTFFADAAMNCARGICGRRTARRTPAPTRSSRRSSACSPGTRTIRARSTSTSTRSKPARSRVARRRQPTVC